MCGRFLNGYFILRNTYTAAYGGMLLWGTSLPKFIDMISVFAVALEPSPRDPTHLLPWWRLNVKTPFVLVSIPPFIILASPLTNLNCRSPFTTGNSSTGKSQEGQVGKIWQKSTNFVLSMSHVTHMSSTCGRQRRRTSSTFRSIG